MSEREKALLEALRVRPNAKAMQALRDDYHAWNAMGGTPTERMAVHALGVLIENHDKVQAVLAEHGATT
jgi:hypothetical protein